MKVGCGSARLWRTLGLQDEWYGLSAEWSPTRDYEPLTTDCSDDELRAFVLRNDESVCAMYPVFRGHAAKPYYETVDGVGTLLFALLELDNPDTNLGGIF